MKIVWNDKSFHDDIKQITSDILLIEGNLLLGEAQQRAPYDKGQLRGSGHVAMVEDDTVRISFNTEYAAIQHEGGDIYPVNAKALSIPVHKDAKGRSPREFSDLIYIKRKGKAPLLVRKIGQGRIQVMYVLVKKVHIEGTKYLSTAVEDNYDRVIRDIGDLLAKKSKFIRRIR